MQYNSTMLVAHGAAKNYSMALILLPKNNIELKHNDSLYDMPSKIILTLIPHKNLESGDLKSVEKCVI